MYRVTKNSGNKHIYFFKYGINGCQFNINAKN